MCRLAARGRGPAHPARTRGMARGRCSACATSLGTCAVEWLEPSTAFHRLPSPSIGLPLAFPQVRCAFGWLRSAAAPSRALPPTPNASALVQLSGSSDASAASHRLPQPSGEWSACQPDAPLYVPRAWEGANAHEGADDARDDVDASTAAGRGQGWDQGIGLGPAVLLRSCDEAPSRARPRPCARCCLDFGARYWMCGPPISSDPLF